ncbi:hypothetical protein BH18ACT10_BH18ACT10_03900 [soil metagenome]|nr:hypothetical protein [Rubrobacter sp.]
MILARCYSRSRIWVTAGEKNRSRTQSAAMPDLQAWHARLEDRAAYQRTVMVSFEKEDPARHED